MTIFSNHKDDVDFIVARRFPFARMVRGRASFPGSGTPGDSQSLKEIQAYENELMFKPQADFQALLAEERCKEKTELEAQAERKEKAHFFNQPDATADFSHWSRTAYWTLDEAIALSFGRAPAVVNWASIKNYAPSSQFAAKYAHLRDLVERARTAQQLSDPIWPGIYIAWANRNAVGFPADLEAALIASGTQVADWKTLYEHELRAKEQLVVQLNELRSIVENERAQLEGAAKTKPLSTKERDSLLKLVIGMAKAYFGYDPKETRSRAPSEIASDLARVGISMHVDTVRKYVEEASEHLPAVEE